MTALAGHQSGNPLRGEQWIAVTMPAMAIVGGKSPAWFHNGTRALARTLLNAEYRVLDGQNHMVKARALAPMVLEFLVRDGGVRPDEVRVRQPTLGDGPAR
jgi:hypothetical protein